MHYLGLRDHHSIGIYLEGGIASRLRDHHSIGIYLEGGNALGLREIYDAAMIFMMN